MNPVKRKIVYWLLHFVPPCEEITHQLSESLDHRLSVRDWIMLRLHLYTCDWCTRYGEQIELVDRVVRTQAARSDRTDQPQHRLPADARERLLRRLTQSEG